MNADDSGSRSVVVRRTVAARPSELFEAWTVPAMMTRWFHMGPGWATPDATSDPRAGGVYEIVMRTPAGDDLQYSGQYRYVEPPHVFAMTWPAYARPEMTTILRVALELVSDTMTEVVITHLGLPDEESREDHRIGWEGVLEMLDRVYGSGDDAGN